MFRSNYILTININVIINEVINKIGLYTRKTQTFYHFMCPANQRCHEAFYIFSPFSAYFALFIWHINKIFSVLAGQLFPINDSDSHGLSADSTLSGSITSAGLRSGSSIKKR